MNAYEKSFALPFDVYQKFVEMQKVEPKIYEYLGYLGFLFDNEREYADFVSGFELISKEPDRHYWENEGNNEKLRQCHVAGIDNLCSTFKLLSESVVKDGIILESGCGDGVNAEWLRRNTNAEVKGLDYSRSMLNVYRRFQPKPDCIVGDSERLPIKNDSIDQVFLIGLIGVQKDEDSMLRIYKEANRVLKPGGEVRVIELCTILDSMLGVGERPIKNDVEFIRRYMSKSFNSESQRPVFSRMETLDLRDEFVIETMETFMEHNMDADYMPSMIPTLPRGLECHHFFRIPYVIIGRKIA